MSNKNPEKQPKVFYLSCFTSVGERFGFYVISFLLVLFCKNTLNFSDSKSFELFAIFTALAFVMPALGGYLADNVLGIRRAMILGLFFEGLGLLLAGLFVGKYFYVSLSLVIIGVGFFKTTPTDLLARAYKDNDPRIDSGFTIFYMFMNVGSFLAPIIAGYLQYRFGWNLTFLSGSISLLLSLCCYFIMRKNAVRDDVKLSYKSLSLKTVFFFIIGILLTFLLVHILIINPDVATYAIFIASALVLIYFIFEMIRSEKEERNRIFAALFLIFSGMIFFVLYYQLYTSMTLFIQRSVVHVFLGFHFPTTFLLAFNPFWIIVLSPVLAKLYVHFGRKGKDLAVTTKFSLGLVITSLAFFIIVLGSYLADARSMVNPLWVFFALFLYSLGELLISALGVAMVTRIAPRRLYGVMMGAWFLLGAALASDFSGLLASIVSIPGCVLCYPAEVLETYSQGFLVMGLCGFAIGLLSFLAGPYIKKIAQLK